MSIILEKLKKEIEKTQVVILAGGSAKRMGNIEKPKALLEIGNKTLLDNEIEFFANCGFKNFVLLLGYKHEQILEHIEKKGYKNYLNLEISIDPTTQNWGKGKALKYAYREGKIKRERFIISFPDDLKLDSTLPIKLLSQHLSIREREDILGTITLSNGIEFPFGVAKLDEKGRIISFIEKPLVNTLTSIGLYIFEPEVLDYIDKYIDLNSPKAIEFEEVILPLLASQNKLYSLIVPSEIWIPINDLKAYEKVKKMFS
ncbi:MAG: nucleotidyltransferase family protein [Candidatus Aenigmatarchaeota archaeon]